MRLLLPSVAILAVAAVALIIGSFALSNFRYHATTELDVGIKQIEDALNRYAIDNEGIYPSDINELVMNNYLQEWPTNPFGGRIRPLSPEANPQPGCFTYVLTAIEGETDKDRNWMSDMHVEYQLPVYSYWELVIYGKFQVTDGDKLRHLSTVRRAEHINHVNKLFAGRMPANWYEEEIDPKNVYNPSFQLKNIPSIQWNRVCALRTSVPVYVSFH